LVRPGSIGFSIDSEDSKMKIRDHFQKLALELDEILPSSLLLRQAR
jgi:hypothetical protein